MLGILISNIIYIIYHKNIYIQWSLYIGTSPHLGWSLAGTTDPHFSILHWPQSSQSVLTTTPGQQIVQGLLLSSGFCLKTTSSLWINFYQCRGWCSIFITSFLLKIMVQPSENPWQMLQIAQGIIHTFMVHCVFYWGHGPASGTQRKIWSLTNRNLSMMRFFAHFP